MLLGSANSACIWVLVPPPGEVIQRRCVRFLICKAGKVIESIFQGCCGQYLVHGGHPIKALVLSTNISIFIIIIFQGMDCRMPGAFWRAHRLEAKGQPMTRAIGKLCELEKGLHPWLSRSDSPDTVGTAEGCGLGAVRSGLCFANLASLYPFCCKCLTHMPSQGPLHTTFWSPWGPHHSDQEMGSGRLRNVCKSTLYIRGRA